MLGWSWVKLRLSWDFDNWTIVFGKILNPIGKSVSVEIRQSVLKNTLIPKRTIGWNVYMNNVFCFSKHCVKMIQSENIENHSKQSVQTNFQDHQTRNNTCKLSYREGGQILYKKDVICIVWISKSHGKHFLSSPFNFDVLLHTVIVYQTLSWWPYTIYLCC